MSEEVYKPFPDNLPFADGYGYIYSILGVTFALLHLRLASVIFWYKEYWNNPCYKIIAVICTSEIWQNLIHAFTGFVMLFKPSESTVFEIIIGSLGHGGWIGMIILDFILSLNRLDVFRPPNFPIRFGPKRIYLLVGMASLISMAFMAILMTPLCEYGFHPSTMSWGYEPSPWAEHVRLVEFVITLSCCIGSFTVYLMVFGIMVHLRHRTTHSAQKVSSSEVRMLAQCGIHFLSTLATIISYHLIGLIPEEVPNMLWLFTGGLLPVLYLVFNQSIRERFFFIFRKFPVHKSNVHTAFVSSEYRLKKPNVYVARIH